MSKRFIDTGLFDDSWFFELSKDAKLAWIFLLTKCNHAGFFDVSFKLAEIQTGVKCFQTVIKELGNRLVTVSGNKLFIPKFISYQYPNGLNENVKAQKSVIDLLAKNSIDLNSYQTVSEQLGNTLLSVNDIDKDKDKDKDKDTGTKKIEILHELQKAVKENLKNVSALRDQLTAEQCEKVITRFGKELVWKKLKAMENWTKLKSKVSVYLTLIDWCEKDLI